jgi:hypothetical protein
MSQGVPFFRAATGQHAGTGLNYRHKFTRSFGLSSLALVDGPKYTALADASWQHRDLSLGAGGGWLENRSLWQARAQYHWDGHLSLSANFLRYQGLTTATVMGAWGLGPLSIYATELAGTRSGQVLGGNLRTLGWVEMGATYLRYHASDNLTLNTGQRLGRRIVVREFASRDGTGRWNVSIGGGFVSNRLSVDVNRQSFITPLGRAPIAQSLVVNVRVVLPWRSITLNSASGLLPDGRWRYGADGGAFIGNGLGSPGNRATSAHQGEYLITGSVLDDKGQPVSGAAIRLGKDLVFSDNTGVFFWRVKHERAVSLAVVPSEFCVPGAWEVVTAPERAIPGEPVRIVVRRGAL